MRTVLGVVALVASLFVWSQPAKATALELLGQCETLIAGAQVNGDSVRLPQNPDAFVCWGFMSAIQEASALTNSPGSCGILGATPPPETTLLQMVRVFVQYARLHPKDLHKRAALVAMLSLREAFPC